LVEDHRLGFHHDEPLIVVMRVNNPDRSSFNIESRDPAPTPTGFAEIVSNDFPVDNGGFRVTDWLLRGTIIVSESEAIVLEAFAAVDARDANRLKHISHPEASFVWPESVFH
jgi:hypothetical protein